MHQVRSVVTMTIPEPMGIDVPESKSMANLPAEIADEIVRYLPVDSAWALQKATHHSPQHTIISRSCSLRTSINHYFDLGLGLGNGSLILASMSKNFVYLSGSRSLEYFVPGSTTEASDWDFYVPDDALHISAFLGDMERVGVIWLSPLEEILGRMERRKGGYVRVPCEAYHDTFGSSTLVHMAAALGFDISPGPVMSDLRAGLAHINTEPCIYIEVDCEQKLVTECISSHNSNHSYFRLDSIKVVIQGVLRREDKITDIQLIVEHRDHPLQPNALFDFHSSCVQSYLSAHVACHFYGRLASAHITYIWKNNITRKKARQSVQKYLERGFRRELVPYYGFYKAICASGDQATFLAGFNFTNAKSSLVAEYEYWARRVRWQQTHYCTERLAEVRGGGKKGGEGRQLWLEATREIKREVMMRTDVHRMATLWGVGEGERRRKVELQRFLEEEEEMQWVRWLVDSTPDQGL